MHGKAKHCACDMRGFLSFQILWLLSKQDMCGNMLADEIGKRKGEKPKAGTIYPALKELAASGLIKGSRSGKEIVYSLTASGKEELATARSYFIKAFGEILTQ